MRLLDLFCCQGGASMGYHRAGFEVTGVDLHPQPRYPLEFIQADAIEFVREHGHKFDVIVGSPPCQRYSLAQRIQGREHPDLIGPFRNACLETGKPYVIENVEDARPELIDPVTLCGSMFGLHTNRHRLFESNVPIAAPAAHPHWPQTVKMGRALQEGDVYHAVGNFSNVDYVRRDMGVPWMTRDGIRECIPPAYAEYIGRQLMAYLTGEVAA